MKFPSLPSFASPKAFAIDISDTTLQCMEVRGRENGHVTSFIHADIPTGLVEQGKILDQAKLAETIRTAVHACEPRAPRSKKVVAELPESQSFTHHFRIEGNLEREGLQTAVRERAEQTMPFALEEYAWDFEVLQTTVEAAEVLFAAAPKDIIAAYRQTLSLAGLDLEILEVESMALARATIDAQKLPERTLGVVMDIGGRTTTTIFVDQNGLQLSVSSPIAGDALTQAMASSLTIDAAAADRLKREKGFQDEKAANVLRTALAPLADQFRQAVAYIQQKTGGAVQQVFLAGGSSALPGIVEELKTVLNIQVDLAKPPYEAKGLLPHQIAVVSGLALRAKKLSPGINFLR